MPSTYQAYYVMTYSIMSGKMPAALDWYANASEVWSRMPGVRSVRGYVQQFSLGPRDHDLEVWLEIEDYATLDRWDSLPADLAAEYLAQVRQAQDCVRLGRARIMGDFAGSVPEALGGDLPSAPAG